MMIFAICRFGTLSSRCRHCENSLGHRPPSDRLEKCLKQCWSLVDCLRISWFNLLDDFVWFDKPVRVPSKRRLSTSFFFLRFVQSHSSLPHEDALSRRLVASSTKPFETLRAKFHTRPNCLRTLFVSHAPMILTDWQSLTQVRNFDHLLHSWSLVLAGHLQLRRIVSVQLWPGLHASVGQLYALVADQEGTGHRFRVRCNGFGSFALESDLDTFH